MGKSTIFIGQNQAVLLFIVQSERLDGLPGKEEFHKFDQKPIIGRLREDYLEGVVIQNVCKSCHKNWFKSCHH